LPLLKLDVKFDLPLLKLDVKFDLPTYDGDLVVEKLDYWVKHIEVYCRIKKIIEDNTVGYSSPKRHNLDMVEDSDTS
jgi:hypothetical protein